MTGLKKSIACIVVIIGHPSIQAEVMLYLLQSPKGELSGGNHHHNGCGKLKKDGNLLGVVVGRDFVCFNLF